ncbi:unnamed protein product [Albugo candida]|uniref:Uncharacterized protein n=1 Tax=Albugo candida TaxID=65357 RepID=A0A024GCL0_9STRA|nr:unnamed protein product [Albugo candida]|eukprot:CCI44391.1 unnamed protein product [Albugo candida]
MPVSIYLYRAICECCGFGCVTYLLALICFINPSDISRNVSSRLSTTSLCASIPLRNCSHPFSRELFSPINLRSSSSISGSSRVLNSSGMSEGFGVAIRGIQTKCWIISGSSSLMFSSCLEITIY